MTLPSESAASGSAASAATQPLRIVCIIHSLDGGGAERVIARLSSMLAERQHEVHLVTLDDASRDRHTVASGVTRHPLNVLRPSVLPGNGRRRGFVARVIAVPKRLWVIRRQIFSLRPDVVLSFCDSTNVNTLLALWGSKLPVVVAERSDPSRQLLKSPWETLRRRLYRRAAAVTVQTNVAADYLSQYIGRDVVVIPSAVDPPPASMPPDSSSARDFDAAWQKQTVVGVGRLSREKGFHRLVDAFSKIADQHPEWKLNLFGDGPQREELSSQIDRLGQSDRVKIHPWQRPIWPVYRDASLVAITSRYEGFPSVLLEAMSSGVACVAVRTLGGVGEIITDRHNGFLCDGDADDIARSIDQLIRNPDLARRLGKNAVSVSERFSWPTMADRYESLLHDVSQRISHDFG